MRDSKVTSEVEYLTADQEEEYVVAQANAPLHPDGTFRNPRVLARRSPQAASLEDLKLQLEEEHFFGATTEIVFAPPAEIERMDVSPKQIVSVATALIPFLEHDDANRALMGANMQRQAVPLHRAEAPYIGTGIEARAARDAADVILALDDGVVADLDGRGITMRYKTLGDVVHPLARSPAPTRTPASATTRWCGPGRRSPRATCWPTARPRTTVSWRWARTSWWPTCAGRATTLRTPSSSASGWCVTMS